MIPYLFEHTALTTPEFFTVLTQQETMAGGTKRWLICGSIHVEPMENCHKNYAFVYFIYVEGPEETFKMVPNTLVFSDIS